MRKTIFLDQKTFPIKIFDRNQKIPPSSTIAKNYPIKLDYIIASQSGIQEVQL